MVIADLSLYLAFMDLVTQVVCAVIRNHRGAYLATQRDSGSFEGLWEFPGGKVEKGESIEEATCRELEEELAVQVIPVGVLLKNLIQLESKTLELIFVEARLTGGIIQLREHKAYRWLMPEDLKSVDWLPGDIPMVDRLISEPHGGA